MARTLGPGSLTFGEAASQKEWGADVSAVTLTPSTSGDDPVPMLDGSTIDGEDTTTYELSGTVYQDFDMDSLIVWCEENKGSVMPAVFVTNAGGLEVSMSVKIRPIALGGDVKAKNTSDFAFPLIGAPTYAAAT